MDIKEKLKKINKNTILIIAIIILMCGVLFYFQTRKSGFHEDEGYTLCSSVSPIGGLMTAYERNDLPEGEGPAWKTKEGVTDFLTLTPDNYFNMKALYDNQASDNHPPFFYTCVHFSAILFGGQFTKYSAFVVNIIAFIASCVVIVKLLKLIDKENITIATLILYGLSMGTISMVIYQRMYMLLTLFILLYFYYSVKLYKNDFKMDTRFIIEFGLITIIGFLVQYFFAIFAVMVFAVMFITMIKQKKFKELIKYLIVHIAYAGIGVALFTPCIGHLLYSDRGLKNLGNSNYFTNFGKYFNHLMYAFSINSSILVMYAVVLVLFIVVSFRHEKTLERFVVILATIPSIIFFAVTVKLTTWQELRYIMPVIPYVAIVLFIVLDTMIDVKYKNYIFVGLSVFLVLFGLITSKPKFLYENYEELMNIAEENKDKHFVYVYDNFFNHMQSLPEMMTYEKTLIVNTGKNEMDYVVADEELNKEDSYILSIKAYMNNDEILEKIKNETEFKNIKALYISGTEHNDELVLNNLYLVSK